MKQSKSTNRALRRKQNTKSVNNSLISLPQITTILNLSKEEMERMLISQNVRISGVLYDCPVFQLNEYLVQKQYGQQSYTLNRSKDQTPKEDIY